MKYQSLQILCHPLDKDEAKKTTESRQGAKAKRQILFKAKLLFQLLYFIQALHKRLDCFLEEGMTSCQTLCMWKETTTWTLLSQVLTWDQDPI